MRKFYSNCSLIFTNFFLLVVGLNLLLWAIFAAHDAAQSHTSEIHRLEAPLHDAEVPKLYPGWTPQQVRELYRDTIGSLGLAEETYDSVIQLRPRPFHSRFVNIEEPGFRRIRNQAPWPPQPSAHNIFVFGGSTAFGLGMDDNNTIASYIQQAAAQSPQGSAIRVYNFGRPGYTSTQEMLLYLWLLRNRFVPSIAVFIDGLNECQMGREAGLPVIPYPENPVREAISAYQQRRAWHTLLESLPMTRLAHDIRAALQRKRWSGPPVHPKTLARVKDFVIHRWIANRQAILALSKAYHVTPVFVWQPTAVYRYDLSYNRYGATEYHQQHWAIPLVYPEIESMAAKGMLGSNFLDLSGIQQDKMENLYVDAGHYTAAFSAEIGRDIYQFLMRTKPNSAATNAKSRCV